METPNRKLHHGLTGILVLPATEEGAEDRSYGLGDIDRVATLMENDQRVTAVTVHFPGHSVRYERAF